MNPEKMYAFVEFFNFVDADIAMCFDGTKATNTKHLTTHTISRHTTHTRTQSFFFPLPSISSPSLLSFSYLCCFSWGRAKFEFDGLQTILHQRDRQFLFSSFSLLLLYLFLLSLLLSPYLLFFLEVLECDGSIINPSP